MAETWLLAEFGKRLREARLSVGMSQAALAAASGVNRAYISEIESGKQNISMETMASSPPPPVST